MSLNIDRFTGETLGRNGTALQDPHFHTPARRESPPACGRSRLGRFVLFACAVAIVALIAGFAPRLHKRSQVALQTKELSIPVVRVTSPSPAKAPPPLRLSGELKPYIEAPIYARATGYVRKWNVDLGSQVVQGQLMAELETPELDQQLSQARADLKHAEAALALAQITAKRWTQMLASKTISSQEADVKAADVTLTRAAVESARANVERFEQMAGFANIAAPFAGTVTARSLDIGQLVTAGSGQELFRVARTDKLRVFVRVPQNYAQAVTAQQNAEITMPDMPGRKFAAKVVRTAGAIDAASRTLLTELEVDNSKGEIFAGSYCQVQLSEAKLDAPITVAPNTLLFRPDGPVVAVLDGSKVRLHHVQIGRDFGTAVEILDGLQLTDKVVINPPDSLVDGIEVRVSEPKKGA